MLETKYIFCNFPSSVPSQELQIALGGGFLQGKADDTARKSGPRQMQVPGLVDYQALFEKGGRFHERRRGCPAAVPGKGPVEALGVQGGGLGAGLRLFSAHVQPGGRIRGGPAGGRPLGEDAPFCGNLFPYRLHRRTICPSAVVSVKNQGKISLFFSFFAENLGFLLSFLFDCPIINVSWEV